MVEFDIIFLTSDLSTLPFVPKKRSVAETNPNYELLNTKPVVPKNRIHLSRSLRAQTTPYPNAHRWLRRGLILVALVLVVGIYAIARPGKAPESEAPAENKQILGDQETEDNTPTEYATYRVKGGDTLFNLSQKYGVSWQTLAELNGLQEPYVLKIGQQLKVPNQ